MDWEPQLAPPIDQPSSEEYTVGYPWGTALVAGLLTTLFIIQSRIVPPSCTDVAYPGACTARSIMEAEPFLAVISFPLLHGDITHLLSNLLPLLVLGSLIERERSSPTFIGLFGVAGYLSIYGDIAMGVAMGSSAIAIGSSGAVRAIGAFLLVQSIPIISTPAGGLRLMPSRPTVTIDSAFRIIGIVLALYLILSSILEYIGLFDVLPEIAIFAHLVGATIGILSGLFVRPM